MPGVWLHIGCFWLGRVVPIQHINDFAHIGVKFFETGGLRMRTRPAGNIPNKKPCIGATFDDCGDVFHSWGQITNCDHLYKSWVLIISTRYALARSIAKGELLQKHR